MCPNPIRQGYLMYICFIAMSFLIKYKSFLLFIIVSTFFSVDQTYGEVVSFNRDIRPILSSKCFFCHGPSEKSRKAKLRLDIEEEAFRQKDGLAAFVRKSVEDSEAWHRINSENPD